MKTIWINRKIWRWLNGNVKNIRVIKRLTYEYKNTYQQ